MGTLPPMRAALALLLMGGAAAQTPLAVRGLPENAPVAVVASATDRVLLVDLTFDDQWHGYSRDVGGGMPVGLALDEECDYVAQGEARFPADEDGVLEGRVRLRLPIEAATDGAGPRELRATVHLQVCDALECLAPMTLEIAGEVEAVEVLLVTPAEDEHRDRVAAWLEERAFVVRTATYATVTAEACDGADVVLADSRRFRENGDATGAVKRFPRTQSPIVAVGFLGTELVEAHGVAMTSGYI